MQQNYLNNSKIVIINIKNLFDMQNDHAKIYMEALIFFQILISQPTLLEMLNKIQ